MFALFSYRGKIAIRHALLLNTTKELKLEITIGHLWFEEIISGDPSIQIKNVWAHLDKAERCCDLMLKGGEEPGRTLTPVVDPHIRYDLERARKLINSFKQTAQARWEHQKASLIGSDIDQHFDLIYEDLFVLIEQVEASLQQNLATLLTRYNMWEMILVFSILILGVVVGFFFKHYQQKQISNLNILSNQEKKLRLSKEKFEVAVRRAPIPMILTDHNQDIVLYNNKFTKLFGYTLEDISTAAQWWSTVYPDDNYREQVKQSWEKAIAHATESGGDIDMQEWDLIIKDGSVRRVEFQMTPLGDINLIAMNDITERKKAEQAIQGSEKNYRALFEESPIPLWDEDFSQVKSLIDQQKNEGITDFRSYFDENPEKVQEYAGLVKIIDINKAVLTLHEAKSKKELILGLQTVFTEASFATFKEELIAMAEGHYQCEFEATVKTLKGKERYIYIKWAVVPGYEETMEKVYISTVDITSRKQAERALAASESGFREAQRLAHIGNWELNLVNNELTWSDEVYRIFGLKPQQFGASYEAFLENIHPEDRALVNTTYTESVKNKTAYHLTHRLLLKDGTLKYVNEQCKTFYDDQGKPTMSTGTILDITELKQAEKEKQRLEKHLRKSQKLEAIGTLAAGIAHDFNNILTPIMGYSEMTLARLPADSSIRGDVSHILKGANRAKDLVKQILLFSKKVEKEKIPLSLFLVIEEAIKLLRPSIPATISISQRIDSTCRKVLADPSQMHQIIINLCTNAWQAMEESGGILTVALQQVSIDNSTVALHPKLNQGDYARLSVIDTGVGMDQIILERIFDPFFTTKEVNKGTGMGLSVVHGIVESHHGDVLVSSKKGIGSEFHVFIPIFSGEEETVNKVGTKSEGGKESILVVDDEDTIAFLIKRMLERFGYKADTFNSSLTALEAFRLKPEKYDMLITDLTMPMMTGRVLSGKFQEIRPGFPVIMITGYGDTISEKAKVQYGIRRIIGKPIEMNELGEAVRAVFDSTEG